MSGGKVEFEVFRAWEGCRWCWYVMIDGKTRWHGVEESAKEALNAALWAYEGRKGA